MSRSIYNKHNKNTPRKIRKGVSLKNLELINHRNKWNTMTLILTAISLNYG